MRDSRRYREPKGKEATNEYLRDIAVALESQLTSARMRTDIENDRNIREKERHEAFMRQVRRQEQRQKTTDDLVDRTMGRLEFYKERVLILIGKYKGEK